MSGSTTKKTSGRFAAAALAAGLLLTGCGHGMPAVTAAASIVLSADVQGLQAAARTGGADHLGIAGDRLRGDIANQLVARQISGDRAQQVLVQLARVLADTAAAAGVSTVAPKPTPAPPAPPATGRHSKGKGSGGGHDG